MSSDHEDKNRRGSAVFDTQSRIGHKGQLIPTHRAILHFNFPRTRLLSVLLLPVLFSALAWPAIRLIGVAWREFFAFWMERLDLGGTISTAPYGPAWLDLSLPYLDIAAPPPNTVLWWGSALITLAMIALSPLISDKLLPLRYLVRVIAFIQTTALLFFHFLPERFPYTLATHLESFTATTITLMLVLPWIHALIYYIFNFSLIKKAAFTMLSLFFCCLLAPFLIMTHAYVAHAFSLLQLPVMYFMFGLFPLFMTCIALYGWAMSWENREQP